MSGPRITEEQAKAAQELLTRFHRQDRTGGVEAGAMRDGCKRGRTDEDYDDWQRVTYDEAFNIDRPIMEATTSTQAPVIPAIGEPKVKLPAGVDSIEDWGTTICRLPKVAHLDASYEELAQMAERHEYLKWVYDHGQDQGGRFQDFANYLSAVDFPKIMEEAKEKAGPCFPDSKTIRERKPKK